MQSFASVKGVNLHKCIRSSFQCEMGRTGKDPASRRARREEREDDDAEGM